MDKSQKELIKTYYRKRGIAVGQGYPYESHELSKESIESGLTKIDKETLKDQGLRDVIVDKPELIPTIMKYIDFNDSNVFGIGEITKILRDDPKLIKLFVGNSSIGGMYFGDIINVLHKEPQSITYFLKYIDRTNKLTIAWIIRTFPEFIDYFKNDLTGIDIKNIILAQPKLINSFVEYFDKLSREDISSIVVMQPQLKKYFTNG
jgi:hypothetical protein